MLNLGGIKVAKWRMYIDDSATHGSVMGNDFQPIAPTSKGMMPVTTAGGILVPEHAETSIIADVRKLRRKIRRELDLDTLPELHMRLMWGKDLPQKNNPYLLATAKQRLLWVKQGYDIIFRHGRRGHLKVAGVGLEIPQVQEVLGLYCAAPETQSEYAFIKKHFPKATKGFYNVMFNPLVRMIMNLVIVGDYFCRRNAHRLNVYYDTSEASKGFTSIEGMEVMHSTRRFASLQGIHETSARESELMQLADFVAYRIFRGKLMRYRLEHQLAHSTDAGMVEALRGRDLSVHGLSLPNYLKIESYHESLLAMLQVSYAAQIIRDKYPLEAAEYLIPTKGYNVNLDEHGSLTGFFPVVHPEIVAAWSNGKRPPHMSGPPYQEHSTSEDKDG